MGRPASLVSGLVPALVGSVLVFALLGGCVAQPDDTNENGEQDVATGTHLKNAAIYECEDGSELEVVFEHDPSGATVLVPGGEPAFLTMGERAEVETYSNGDLTLKVGMGGDTVFVRDGVETACRGVGRSLAPPVLDAVVKDLRAGDDGSELSLMVGDMISVSLVGVPTAGYQWAVETMPDFIEEADSTGGATSTAQFLPGFTGGNHWEVLTFRAIASGSGELVLAERRPWEDSSEPADDTFRVRLTVK